MTGSVDTDFLDTGATRKVLRLLDALRQSQAGSVIYRQVERMLDELVTSNHGIQQAYAGIAGTLLDVFAGHLHSGSPLQIQVKLLRTRLQPPLSVSDLQALQQYIDVYQDQIAHIQDLDQAVFAQAIRPLLQAYGIEDEVSRVPAPVMVANKTPTSAYVAPTAIPPVFVHPAPDAEPVVKPRPLEPLPPEVTHATHPETERQPHTWPRPQFERHPLDGVNGQPTLVREPERDESGPVGEADENRVSVYRSQLDARRRYIQELQAGLSQQVLDTIAQNQEFGVLLEVVLSELRQVGEVSDLENLRWTLIREIEKLMSGHHELADKLDNTHHYLQVIESDSRQLTDELTRVRLLSLTDELTGLPNRRAFLRRLEDEVARVQRYGFPLSLAMIDLDKFKEINDKYGHAGGDEVLRVYSKNILSIFRHHDLVARYGGEEFAVLLPNTEREGALRALNKVKNRCAETRWQSNGSVVSVPMFSAGLALYKPGETSTAFVERVDKALYRAKRLGRNRVEIDMTYQTDADEQAPTQKGAEPTT
ncbi:MAG: GGDEF domain-containing protein [Gammaproteobacteria bacterium]|nr:GGDEF domain-containing protein [Gammaproteobacteria bacterium]